MKSKKTILLTGATGFVGSHILKALDRTGDFKVIVLKRSFSRMERIAPSQLHRTVFFDIDKGDIAEVFENYQVNIVVHAATEYGRKDGSLSKILEANLLYPIGVIELAIKYGCECFINTDSYFNKEHYSYNYLLDYSLSKKSFLSWIRKLSEKIGVINVVLEHVYGETDNADKFVEKMIQSIAVNREATVNLTHGHQRRDFVYIADVVRAYLDIIYFSTSNKFRYKEFNVGTGVASEIKLLVERIKSISCSPTILNFGAIDYRSDEIMESKADISELKSIGWSPMYTIDSGLISILNSYAVN